MLEREGNNCRVFRKVIHGKKNINKFFRKRGYSTIP